VLDVVASNPNGGSAHFTASETGPFAHQAWRTPALAGAPIEWMDRAGRRLPLRAMPTNWGNRRFSPDGSRLAVEINDGKQQDVWVYEWAADRGDAPHDGRRTKPEACLDTRRPPHRVLVESREASEPLLATGRRDRRR
jgi:hypothetical protein